MVQKYARLSLQSYSVKSTKDQTQLQENEHGFTKHMLSQSLIQVFSPKQLARPSNTVHIPVVRLYDATAVQQSVILVYGPNYQPCHSDLAQLFPTQVDCNSLE